VTTLPNEIAFGDLNANERCWVVVQPDREICARRNLRTALAECEVADLWAVLPWEKSCVDSVESITRLAAGNVELSGEAARSLLFLELVGLIELSPHRRDSLAAHSSRSPPNQPELFRAYMIQRCQPSKVNPTLGAVRLRSIAEWDPS
jgi:hypothetical protein